MINPDCADTMTVVKSIIPIEYIVSVNHYFFAFFPSF